MLRLLTVVVIYFAVGIRRLLRLTKCPSNEILHPCDCHYDNIRCTGDTLYDLKQIFQSASDALNDTEKHFKQFYFNNTAINEFVADVLHDITFEEIIIENAKNLTRISSNAFNQTNFYTRKVEIRFTPIQNNDSNYQIFTVLSKMKVLENIHMLETDITSIPENAFQPLNGVQSRLKDIYISFNRNLKTVGDRAFYELNNLTAIEIYYNEQIDYIPSHLYTFRQRIDDFLIIDLSNNKLNSSSFGVGASNNTGKIYRLNLSGNSELTFLDQSVFEPVLKNGTIIELRSDHLVCDCRMYWIVKNKAVYSKQVTDAKCSDDYDMFIDNRDEFINCV